MSSIARRGHLGVAAGVLLVGSWGCSSTDTAQEPVVVPEAEAPADPDDEARAERERAVRAIEASDVAQPFSEGDVSLVLDYYCGECHGVPPDNPTATDGLYRIDDIDAMIQIGKVSIGDGEGSRLVQLMRNGRMPPMEPGQEPVPPATIDRISRFIDGITYASR